MQKAKDIFQYLLGAVIVVSFFVLMIVLAYQTIPDANKDVINLVIGALIGAFSTVVGYFFGSSLGSSKKTDILNKE